MLLLRSFPEPSRATDATLPAQWGRETCIIWGRARHADFGPCTHTLSIRAAWGGAQYCHVDGRTLAVDDDNFLILNHGRIYSTSIRAARAVESLAICFHPRLAEEVHSDAESNIEQALSGEAGGTKQALQFMENLQPHDKSLGPVLRFIRTHLACGVLDEMWYEEQALFLLSRMRAHREKLMQKVDRLALVRPATRFEVYRRIGLATDYIHTYFARQIDLNTLARMACLSKYHFVRLFTVVHGVTPYVYVRRKRIGVAIRLLESTQLTVSEVASRVGFEHESTLLRQMRRWTNMSPRQIRAGDHEDPQRTTAEGVVSA
jgi:AraC family transcriptional regulator